MSYQPLRASKVGPSPGSADFSFGFIVVLWWFCGGFMGNYEIMVVLYDFIVVVWNFIVYLLNFIGFPLYFPYTFDMVGKRKNEFQ